MTRETDLSILEGITLRHPAVVDCAALRRSTPTGSTKIVVYYVPLEPVEPAELRKHLEASNRELPRPDVFVPVSALPLTEKGGADDEVLSRLSVLEEELVQDWEAELNDRCQGPVAVLVDEYRPFRLPLHLADMMPMHQTERSDERPASGDEGSQAGGGRREAKARPSRPATVDGAPLMVPPGAPNDLVDIFRRASHAAHAGIHYRAVESEDSFQSYAELALSASRILAGLRAAGLEPGDRVLLQLSGSRDFLEGFWATILGGLVPVPMAVPASFRQRSASEALASAWRLLGKPVVLTTQEVLADISAVLAETGSELRAFALDDLRRDAGTSNDWHTPEPDDVALMMLTSGSTGVPKAVQLSHRNLVCRTLASIQLNGFGSDEVSLNWMPLDHVAGLIYFHVRDVALGCRQVQLATEAVLQEPLAWLDALDRFRVSVTFAPNFAYGLVNDRESEIAKREWDLSSLRFILNGAEAIVARTARRFLRLLEPHGLSPSAMHPAWGMSETSSGVTYSDRFSLSSTSDEDEFVEVGRPIPGFSMRIVDERERVVDEGLVGALQVKGAVVTRGYLDNEAANQEAFTEDGWFRTGDLGLLRDGRLTITGREKDVVVINSVKYYSHAIESAVENLDGVVTSFTAACAVRDRSGDTDRLAIFFHPDSFEPHSLSALLKRIRTEVRDTIGIGPDFLVPVDAAAIPKTSLGKIQRSQLAEKLALGVFDDALKNADRLVGSPNTIPDWYFRKTWVRRSGLQTSSSGRERGWLVFTDEEGLGRCLESTAPSGCAVVKVEAGSTFERRSPTYYRVDPESCEDYRRLLASLRGDGIDPDSIVHLWDCRPRNGTPIDAESMRAAQARGSLSVLGLAQALASCELSDEPRTLLVAGSHVARVEEKDRVCSERSSVVGLLKSIAQEMPRLRCVHVDVSGARVSEAATSISSELRMISKEREVAYRGGTRFVARLARVDLPLEAWCGLPFEPGEFCVVTGGLGGIGFEISKFLLEETGLRLLLLGRTEPPLEGERAERLSALRSRSEALAYEPCDVCDRGRLQDIVRKYEEIWGAPLAGALHFAGDYAERLIVEESPEHFLRLIEPRALGALNLEAILRERGGGLLVTSSSLAGFFGGASIGSYSAANAVLDGFHESLVTSDSIQSFCFQWSNWDGVGQARRSQSKELPRSLGYLPISTERALLSFRIGLGSAMGARGGMFVGLDADNRHVRRFVDADPVNLETVGVFVQPGDAERLRSEDLNLRDRFDSKVSFEVVSVESMPFDGEGQIDREGLRAIRRVASRGAGEGRKPETISECALAAIWEEILGAHDVRLEDNFFELGGDSLLAVRAVSRVRDRLGVAISLRTVFENPRLDGWASAVGAEDESSRRSPEAPGSAKRLAEDPAALLDRLDELGDDEVDALLRQMADDDEATD